MDEDKIIVAVCGDSFCAASINDLAKTGTGSRAHFSQMLEDQYGYRVLHLAHGGFGNTAIWFQIKYAIEQKAHVIVYNKTWSHRITLCRHDKFNIQLGLKNFHYYDPNMQSTHDGHGGSSDAAWLSTTNFNIEHSPFFSVTDEQLTAINLYIKHLYTDALHTTMDSWMFDYWHDQIGKSGALAVWFNQDDIGKIAYDFSQRHPDFDTPFHTDRATQVQVAENIHRYIVDNLRR